MKESCFLLLRIVASQLQAHLSLDNIGVLVPEQKLCPYCEVGSVSDGSIWCITACSIYSTLYSVFICFYWDESQASKRQTALIQWWHMPLKTVFLFFFYFFFIFFWKAEWRHFTQTLLATEIKIGRKKAGVGGIIKPYLPPANAHRELASFSKCHLKNFSEAGSSSESWPCLASCLLTSWAVLLHVTSTGRGCSGCELLPLPISPSCTQTNTKQLWKE